MTLRRFRSTWSFAVLKDLLELVEDDDHALPMLVRDLGRRGENILKDPLWKPSRREIKPYQGLSRVVYGENRAESREESLCCIQHSIGPRGSRFRKGSCGRRDECLLAVRRPEVDVGTKIVLLGQAAERQPHERRLAHAPLGEEEEAFGVFDRAKDVGKLGLAIAEGVFSDDSAVAKGIHHITHHA
jgi:hypothetical protein